ncbi:MAG: tetratricopeptide repeat protein [Methylobacter sp.]
MSTPNSQATTAVQTIFAEALALHRQGQLTQATELYQQVLELDPHHFDALHLYGVIFAQTGDLAHAVELIDKSLEINPKNAVAHHNLGKVLHDQKQNEAALKSYDKAIALKPDIAVIYYDRGLNLQKIGQQQTALHSFDQAIALKPDYVEAYNERGNVLQELKQYQAAINSYDHAIALKANSSNVWFNRGNALQALGQSEAALHSYDQAIAIEPDNADTYSNRGNVLQSLGQSEAALQSYAKALASRPDCAMTLNNHGTVLLSLKHYEAALQSFDQAITYNPGFFEAYSNRGIALRNLGQYEAALQNYDQAIALNPVYAKVYSNRGNILQDLGQYDAALQSHHQACIVFDPDDAEANFGLSLCLLQSGDFDNGWKSYEWRLKHEKFGVTLGNGSKPRWTGIEDLQGKTLLLHSEQGMGDTMQFCRYAKLLANRGARVILEVPMPLLLLLARVEGIVQTVLRGGGLPPFDFYCPLLSLPLAFKTDFDTIPTPGRYIVSPPDKLAKWQSRLGPKNRPRIGLAWSGQALHNNDRHRSIPLAQFIKLLPDNFQYVSLQNEVPDTDQETLLARPDILHFGSELEDFTDTAALCDLVDIVVSVDTSVAHLAGAMGKTVWILLPFNPDWRWLLNRSDSPWYATAKLYRRERHGDNSKILDKIKTDLIQLFSLQ